MEDEILYELGEDERREIFLEYLWRLGYVINEETGRIYEADGYN